MEKELHFERGDLTGEISVNLREGLSIDELFSKYIHDYNKDRFEPIAVRILMGKETVITLYAVDKIRQEDSTADPDKIAVKKFKIPGIRLEELFVFVDAFNCTLSTNNYPIEAMEVTNR